MLRRIRRWLLIAAGVGYVLFGFLVLVGFILNFGRAAWPANLWILLAGAAFAGGYFYGLPRLAGCAEYVWHRRMFRSVHCPACEAAYDRRAIRGSKHLCKTKVHGGPPPEAFTVVIYEAWELTCSGCGHTQDFTPTCDPIPADGPEWPDTAAS